MATTTKLNIDKATVRQLFKAVIKATDEINEKSILYGQAKRVLPIKPLAQAAEFYVLNGNLDRIALTPRYPSMVRSRIGKYQSRMGISWNCQQSAIRR